MEFPDSARAYYEQFAGDDPPLQTALEYTVMDYFNRFAVFQTFSYDDALQVATWDCENMKDDPQQRIQSHTVYVNGPTLGGYFTLPWKFTEYEKRIAELHDQPS